MGKKNILNNVRHIRYYSEASDNFDFENMMGKHHLVFVNDPKGIRRYLNQVVENINEVSSGVEISKRLEGKVKNSNLNFLFVTLETPMNFDILRLNKLGVPLKKDNELYERGHTKIEDYVSRLYEE